VPLWRRGAAFAIDFVIVAILSSLLGMGAIAQATVFILAWLGMRVILVAQNQGQSLGRWALDMKVVSLRWGGTPSLQELAKREGWLAFEAMLALFGLINLNPGTPWSILLLLPLIADCILAFLDDQQRQTLHDKACETLIVQTRRGYSLDVKLRRLWIDAQRYLNQRQR
jgi:uncharacterized RDD family membrane protein YckC